MAGFRCRWTVSGVTATDPRLAGTSVSDSVLDLIGRTPIVRLRRLSESRGVRPLLTVKMETTNPGGSAKDRPALEMVLAAERDGLLKPGDTIVEPTSGNTGVGLAIVAAQRGYRCVFVMTDKVAPEKVSLLRAYGAEVVVCPVAVPPEDPSSYYKVAERLTVELGAFRPNQYANPANPFSHYKGTGPEIWEQTCGRVTHFVAGAGTCGTITGTARFLKERSPAVKVVAADPEASVFSGGSGRPYLVEGVGEDFFPAAWEPDLYDEVVAVSDEEAFAVAREVSRVEGILLGGSGGLAVAAALRVAERASPEDFIVVLNPDSGRGYLSRVFDDRWMSGLGFLRADGPLVGDVLSVRSAGSARPELIYVAPSDPVRAALAAMRSYAVSQLLVCKNEPPFALAEMVGSIDELGLMEVLASDPSILDAPVSSICRAPLPSVGIGEPVSRLSSLFESSQAVVVLSGGRPCGVLARGDLLAYFEHLGAPRV